MIYGLLKARPVKERRTTILLLLVYAAIAGLLFYNEQHRENMAENNSRSQPANNRTPNTSPS